MGTRIRFAVVLLSLLCTVEAFAQLRSITFEQFPGPDGHLGTFDDIPIVAPDAFFEQGMQLTTQYASLGVEFLPNPPLGDVNEILNDLTWIGRPTPSSPNLLASSSTTLNGGVIEGRFTVPVFSVGAWLGLSGSADRLEAFSVSNASLGVVTGQNGFFAVNSATPIARFVITNPSPGNTPPGIDNFQFTVVPEPSAATCAALMTFGVGLCRRRRVG